MKEKGNFPFWEAGKERTSSGNQNSKIAQEVLNYNSQGFKCWDGFSSYETKGKSVNEIEGEVLWICRESKLTVWLAYWGEEENEWKTYQTKFTDAFLTSEINKDLDGGKCFHP